MISFLKKVKQKQIITICTANYKKNVNRLLYSLESTNSDFLLTVYCDDKKEFEYLEKKNVCNLIELEEIKTLGVKRAKFYAYVDSVSKSDFLYLDADIIVLDDISELFEGEKFAGCFDDLSGCPFIENKKFPWEHDPKLKNNRYINSGVFYSPKKLKGFFEKMKKEALEDEAWEKYIIPGKLYDNHFLCAFLNKEEIPFEYFDEEKYNWPGFFNKGELMVYRKGNKLLNKKNNKQLKIAHFAGINDIDGVLKTSRLDVSSLLLEKAKTHEDIRENEGILRYMATLSPNFKQEIRDENIFNVWRTLTRELTIFERTRFNEYYPAKKTYLENKQGVLATALALPQSKDEWNGLKCNGEYLEGVEYNFLRNWFQKNNIKNLVQIGLDETKKLFDFIGINSKLVNLSDNESEVLKQLGDLKNNADVLFLESNSNWSDRTSMLDFVIKQINPTYIIIHNALKESLNLFRLQTKHEMNFFDYFNSVRGIAVFKYENFKNHDANLEVENQIVKKPIHVLKIDELEELNGKAGENIYVKMCLENKSEFIYSSKFSSPVLVSYHLVDEARSKVYEGEHMEMPFDFYPGDKGCFEVKVAMPEHKGEYYVVFDLVQEGVAWFGDIDPNLKFKIKLRVK